MARGQRLDARDHGLQLPPLEHGNLGRQHGQNQRAHESRLEQAPEPENEESWQQRPESDQRRMVARAGMHALPAMAGGGRQGEAAREALLTGQTQQDQKHCNDEQTSHGSPTSAPSGRGKGRKGKGRPVRQAAPHPCDWQGTYCPETVSPAKKASRTAARSSLEAGIRPASSSRPPAPAI